MGAPSKPALSILERLDLAVRLGVFTPFKLAYYITRHFLIASYRGLPRNLYYTCAVVKTFLCGFTPRQQQALNPTTRQQYVSWVEDKAKTNQDHVSNGRLVRDVQELPVGDAALLWLGNRRKATKVVLFFHGGGFIAPITAGHLEWCWQTYVLAGRAKGVEVAVGVLQYTLAPGGKYPVQLQQAASALGSILDSGVRPEDLVVGGDSAGGNLTMQVLGHLMHPHPEARVLALERPLSATFMVSPWLSQDTSSRSYKTNNSIDVLTPSLIPTMTRALFNPGILAAQDKRLVLPMDVEQPWLKGIHQVVRDVYVTVGKQELFLDQDVNFVEALKRSDDKINLRFEAVEEEAHDFVLMEGANRVVGDATRRMIGWFQSVL